MILTIRRQITMEGINDVVRYHINDTIFIYFTYALRVRKALHILHFYLNLLATGITMTGTRAGGSGDF